MKIVKDIQRQLKAFGFDPGPIDGRFGPKTEKAVLAFQTAKGLVKDGVVGSQTLAELNVKRCWGTRPECTGASHMVQDIQGQLKAFGFDPGPIDGQFGPKTEEAVWDFQANKGLTRDGVVGPQTLAALNIKRCWANPWSNPECTGGSRMVQEIQQKLKDQGFYNGRIDGVFGVKTEKAVLDFQKSQSLNPDGVMDWQTLTALSTLPIEHVA
ncbi:MAG: peptidoglycan-binding protein [Cyanobacteria bacterium P01_F01_bin.86]